MFIHTKDSTIKLEKVVALTKGMIPATNFTSEYFTVCVYLEKITQPLVHTFETEQDRDELFVEFRNALDVHND